MASDPNAARSISSVPSFSVAIVGGGIGGLVLALGLLEYPQIDVQVYESAPSFGEIGAGVSIAPNAQRALEMISPAAKAAFDKNATGNTWASKAHVAFEYVVVSVVIVTSAGYLAGRKWTLAYNSSQYRAKASTQENSYMPRKMQQECKVFIVPVSSMSWSKPFQLSVHTSISAYKILRTRMAVQ